MSVETKTVPGRRELNFTSLDQVVADAEKLVASPNTKMLGNWPLGQLLAHLATAVNGSIDGVSVKAPWIARLIGPFLKSRILKNKMKPGFKLPQKFEADFFPAGLTSQEAFDQLRQAVARLQKEKMTARHPILGAITHDEWNQLHLRHAELHLSFAVPS